MKELNKFLNKNEKLVLPNDKNLQYSGRIDFTTETEPVFVYPCSYIAFRFTGTKCKIIMKNKREYWSNFLGVILDDEQYKIEIPESEEICISIAENLENKIHSLIIFKRMDACHSFTLYGLLLDSDSIITQAERKPRRRIEVYGDSVSAGEVSEAIDYVGKEDPEHNGEYSNSWNSYAWLLARKLNAEIHDIAQGGAALIDDTGWFGVSKLIGMESIYDKVRYNPDFSDIKEWNFKEYTPHVVIVAIGQNDSHPHDYMAEDYNSEKSIRWRKHYKGFLIKLRTLYPSACIILITTILRHDLSWDKAIEEVNQDLQDNNIYHFIFSQNSIGTKGHIRIPEAQRMSDELSVFIKSLGEHIWND